jgi:hypothetical protein
MVSPILKYPLVAGTLTENEIVATAVNAVNIAIRLIFQAGLAILNPDSLITQKFVNVIPEFNI